MTSPVLAPTFLFRFAVPCYHNKVTWSDKGLQLSDAYRLPSFMELEDRVAYGDLRVAWSEGGLYLTLRVVGKKVTPWCRETKMDESDGLQVWIDTRDTHNVHRATRFCHRFIFLPTGAGPKLSDPVGRVLSIHRAREEPRTLYTAVPRVRSEKRIDGYRIEAHIPSSALSGYEPTEHPRLGFTYLISDNELGPQSFSLGSEFPFDEDPSLWGTLELTRLS